MQLMTFNSLLMFDIVFVFFLFLVGVTCLVYYLPPARSATSKNCRHHSHYHHSQHQSLTHRIHRECGSGGGISSSGGAGGSGSGSSGGGCGSISGSSGYSSGSYISANNSSTTNIVDNCSATVEFFTPVSRPINVMEKMVATSSASPQCCYVKAKQCDVKKCTGPVQDV